MLAKAWCFIFYAQGHGELVVRFLEATLLARLECHGMLKGIPKQFGGTRGNAPLGEGSGESRNVASPCFLLSPSLASLHMIAAFAAVSLSRVPLHDRRRRCSCDSLLLLPCAPSFHDRCLRCRCLWLVPSCSPTSLLLPPSLPLLPCLLALAHLPRKTRLRLLPHRTRHRDTND